MLLMVLIVKLLLDSSPLRSWEPSAGESCDECGYSSWRVKSGLPKPVACLSAQVPRDFGVTFGSSGGLSLGLTSSLLERLPFGQDRVGPWTPQQRAVPGGAHVASGGEAGSERHCANPG